jgi:hypothetical protein
MVTINLIQVSTLNASDLILYAFCRFYVELVSASSGGGLGPCPKRKVVG